MFNRLESRVKYLEKESAKPLPFFLISFENGESKIMDALDIELHLIERDAGKEDTKDIVDYQHISGTLPAGRVWEGFYNHLKKGGAGNSAL